MKKYVKILFTVSLVLVALMLGIFLFHESFHEYIARAEARCEFLTDYEKTTYENPDAPVGITQEYRFTLSDIPKRGGCFMFYTIHQNIEIYIDDVLIYSLMPDENNILAKTVGCDWAKAFLYETDEGKEARILVHPTYESSIEHEITLYYGNHDTICDYIVMNNFPIIAISIITILLGLGFIGFILINVKNLELDRSILMLGIFSCFAGMWQISDMQAAPIIFKNPIILSAVALISLPMMLTPYIYFIRSKCVKFRHLPWNILCIICTSISIIITLLQLLGIADLRETLTLSHITILISVLVVIILITFEARKTQFAHRLKITIACCLLCLLGTLIDMVVFYVSGDTGNMVYCILSFLIYAIVMGVIAIKDARLLMESGKDAKHFEQLAMHDPLTELYNRTYYLEYISKHDMLHSDRYIIMMDVNNLKKCNDTIGHDCGDRLLKNAAEIIQHAFLPNGKCIRMGGDEFCVLLNHVDEERCVRNLNEFENLLLRFNKSYPQEFPVEIAYGYACYDEKQDYDFADTMRRADKMMYRKKQEMKGSIR